MKGPQFTGHKPRSVGLTRAYTGGSPLTEIDGKKYTPKHKSVTPEKPKLSPTMKQDLDFSQYDEITAPPESSDDEAGTTPLQNGALDDDHNSDEEYDKRRTADILKTDFSSRASSNARRFGIVRAPGKARTRKFHSDESSSLAGFKRSAEDDRPREMSQLERDAEEARGGKEEPKRKKKQTSRKYGAQSLSTRPNISKPQPTASQDDDQLNTPKRSFRHPKSLSPMKTGSPPKKFFKSRGQSSDFDETEPPKPSFKKIPMHNFSPNSTPPKSKLRELSPLDEDSAKDDASMHTQGGKGQRARMGRLSKRKLSKAPNELGSKESQRPVFKVPGLEDIDPFDDASPQDVPAISGDQQEDLSDHLDIYELEHTTIPRCPLCNQEVDRALLQKHSTKGKMNVKQQTNFCRLHKRQSAIKLGMEKGYPQIDWEKLDIRCTTYQKFLQDILEGTGTSHYRRIFKDKVNSGKNRTLFTNIDNLTPGYYGPRGLLAMTDFIIRKLSPVIRKRAVEDRLISARSSTGYVQAVLVPELTVRLIMEDMSVSEDKARKIMEESVEIGELLHEETSDVVISKESEDESEQDDEDHELEDSTDEDELAFP